MLSFKRLREVNVTRCKRWHPDFPDDSVWTGGDWSNAMCGEAGEAANIVKKLRRHETGILGGPAMEPRERGGQDELDLLNELGKELADVVLYADLVAAKYGIDLEHAVIVKFNEVSEKRCFAERLP